MPCQPPGVLVQDVTLIDKAAEKSSINWIMYFYAHFPLAIRNFVM
jgi:hypothetical protein